MIVIWYIIWSSLTVFLELFTRFSFQNETNMIVTENFPLTLISRFSFPFKMKRKLSTDQFPWTLSTRFWFPFKLRRNFRCYEPIYFSVMNRTEFSLVHNQMEIGSTIIFLSICKEYYCTKQFSVWLWTKQNFVWFIISIMNRHYEPCSYTSVSYVYEHIYICMFICIYEQNRIEIRLFHNQIEMMSMIFYYIHLIWNWTKIIAAKEIRDMDSILLSE